ncbi:hypothetical protein [Anaerobiospirillum thomasii]|uniref:Uncharacterized protein n=1 Tax=Anaerobiospirillum thomasii TaxID=179995 RepID=A0A2X0VSG0_9GAMM|nr:hypothetical protein [Anaerobiospirillum thomasii]SPT70700.1 Uncharacterised protein [Anaerobiospirillum thomasii]
MSLFILKTSGSSKEGTEDSSALVYQATLNLPDPLYINKIYTLLMQQPLSLPVKSKILAMQADGRHSIKDSMDFNQLSLYKAKDNGAADFKESFYQDKYMGSMKTARDYRSRDRYYAASVSLNSLFCVNNHYLNQGRFMGDALENNDGSRFYQNALNAKYAIKGEKRRSYNTFFTLPEHIQRRLDAINRGVDDEDETKDVRYKESRYYHKVAAMQEQNRFIETKKDKFRRNSKIALIVCLGFAAYYYYVQNFRTDINSVEDMIASLPLQLDEHTTMTAIEDKDQEFIMTIVKDADLYAHVDAQQREESLDRIVRNAQNLCNNPLIGSIVSSGRKVTVLLKSDDNSFERTINIEHCTKGPSQQ